MDSSAEVWEFEKLEQQLHSFLDDMSALSSKKPDGPINKFKLQFLNAILEGINKLINDYRPFADFQQFDIDSLPSNSDVVVILSQYAGAVLRFRTQNTSNEYGDWFWGLKGSSRGVKTGPPATFRYRPK